MGDVLCKVCCVAEGQTFCAAEGQTFCAAEGQKVCGADDSSTGSLAGNFENSCYAFSERRTFHQKSGYFVPVVLVEKWGVQPPESISENGCTLDHLGFVST